MTITIPTDKPNTNALPLKHPIQRKTDEVCEINPLKVLTITPHSQTSQFSALCASGLKDKLERGDD